MSAMENSVGETYSDQKWQYKQRNERKIVRRSEGKQEFHYKLTNQEIGTQKLASRKKGKRSQKKQMNATKGPEENRRDTFVLLEERQTSKYKYSYSTEI